jgi:hypothetical protein
VCLALAQAIRKVELHDLRGVGELALRFSESPLSTDSLRDLHLALQTNDATAPQVVRATTPGFVSVSSARTPSTRRPSSDRPREWALQRIEQALGVRLHREGRSVTYRVPNGKRLHLRTNQRFDRGNGRFSYWFGLDEDKWIPGEYFGLACDTDALLIIPVVELMPHREALPLGGTEGRDRQPNIWRNDDGTFELRARGQHTPLNQWIDRFELLGVLARPGHALSS